MTPSRWPASIRRSLVAAIAAAFVFGGTRDAAAYLKFGVHAGGRTVTLKWSRVPVRYFVANQTVPTVDANAFAAAMMRAFATWQEVATSSITYEFVGFTAAAPDAADGMSTLGFKAAPELDRVLASTSFFVDDLTGELLESDIFFNTAFEWSAGAAGEPGRFDLQSIAVHEIGHMSGLGHSMIGETERTANGRRVLAAETVMFPLAYSSGNTLSRALKADDIAGVSDLYPDGGFLDDTGSVSGRVVKSSRGVFGAHVVAFNPSTRALISNFTLSSNGTFSIAGLTPGPHLLRVEPLDDADIDSFFELDAGVDVDFRATYHDELVVVPRGGDSGTVQITVQP
jgi:hypothetical protein